MWRWQQKKYTVIRETFMTKKDEEEMRKESMFTQTALLLQKMRNSSRGTRLLSISFLCYFPSFSFSSTFLTLFVLAVFGQTVRRLSHPCTVFQCGRKELGSNVLLQDECQDFGLLFLTLLECA